jgi:hypothetical protein
LSTAPVKVRAVVDWPVPPLPPVPPVPPVDEPPPEARGLLAAFFPADAAPDGAGTDGAVADGDVSDCEPASGVLGAAGWNLTASSAAIPTAVPPRAMTARSNECLLLEVERLVVDVAVAQA